MESANSQTSSIDSPFPVRVPFHEALFSTTDELLQGLGHDLKRLDASVASSTLPLRPSTDAASSTEEQTPAPSIASQNESVQSPQETRSKFIQGLQKYDPNKPDDSEPPPQKKMRTANKAIAFKTSGNPLVDAFYELEEVTAGKIVEDVLTKAWLHDAASTLKIIFNARSIHLGKSCRTVFYRSCGWLAQRHPKTLLANLKWLCEPVIEKPKKKTKKPVDDDDDGDFEIVAAQEVDNEEKEDSALKKLGLAHGYWKDLLSILVLAVNDELHGSGDHKSISRVETGPKRERTWDHDEAKRTRHDLKMHRHARMTSKFTNDPVYRALHITVAQLFANRLRQDLAALESANKQDRQNISLAAKWAPSLGGAHDRYTFVASSIAEMLHPLATFDEPLRTALEFDRELYLKHARERYRYTYLGSLRKFLQIVERDITSKSFENIDYDRVPSLAMQRYTNLFVAKDGDRFDQYLDKVASGKANISGAVLLPSTLVSRARHGQGVLSTTFLRVKKGLTAAVANREHKMKQKALDGQWNTLVQRIKDTGSLSSAIAVCDVSGSMTGPKFPDHTCPMDSSIGLSLLLAEVTRPPFGGNIITFSTDPHLMQAGGESDTRDFSAKVRAIATSAWSGSTDFDAVFLKLILPMAKKYNLAREDMVKNIFVFSDMQFDDASYPFGDTSWSTSYEHIQRAYREAGYEMPHMIFWNLAGGRAGYDQGYLHRSLSDDAIAPKPVEADTPGTSLVSGYSQGQLKVFLDGGDLLDAADEGQVETEDETEDEPVKERAVKLTKAKAKIDPIDTVMKAIGHEAYSMLRVVD